MPKVMHLTEETARLLAREVVGHDSYEDCENHYLADEFVKEFCRVFGYDEMPSHENGYDEMRIEKTS